MTEPIKISSQNRPLTCDEYDTNLDIVIDRANHVGTQSCNTINDLDSCLVNAPTITGLTTIINQTTTRVSNLENTLSASGSIANDLNTLESALTADINQNRASITTLEVDLDALEVRVLGTESNLTSLTTLVTNNNTQSTTSINSIIAVNNTQNTRLTSVENRATTLNSNILTEATARQNADNNLQADINAEETNRINAVANVQNNLDLEENARIAGDTQLQNIINSSVDTIEAQITSANNSRIAGDSNLQAQINSLTSSLSSAIPTGSILPYAGNFNVVPTGFLLCAGAAVSRTTYSTLFSIISTRYGSGNGTSTFNLPDLRDRSLYGAFGGNLDSASPTLGSNSKTLSIANIPSHTHNLTEIAHTHTVNTEHAHGLSIKPHNHTAGTIGAHSHSLNPYRLVALGDGDNGNGAELSAVPGGSNTYPNTATNNASGPVISNTTISIYPVGQDPNVNKTDLSGGTITTTSNSNANTVYTTSSQGSGTSFDVVSASVRLNFIIKT